MSVALAFLDANVLVPPSLRDTLLGAAEARMFDVRWSDAILAEVAGAARRIAPAPVSVAAAARLVGAMDAAFPEASVCGYEHLIASTNDSPSDRHVLAAAVASGAPVIVTLNLRHFPQAVLGPLTVEAQHPDAFLCDLFQHDAEVMTHVVERLAAALRRPPRSVDDVIDSLSRFMPRFAQLVRDALGSRR